MRSISVVVTGDTSAATAVRSLVGDWTRAGITGFSLWVRPADVHTESQPAQVFASVVTADGEEQVDLFAHLGRFRLQAIRVVVAQLAAAGDEADPAVSAVGAHVADMIRSALPRHPSGKEQTRLHRTLLLVPASDVAGVDRRILLPAWEANVVISPEDRPDLDRSSVLVRPATNYAGHAAAAVSAVAGLVRGVSEGVFDRVTSDSSTRPEDVLVARIAIRTVVGEDVLDVITRRVLDPGTLTPGGPGKVVTWANPAAEPGVVIDRATRTLLTAPEWAPSPAVDLDEPGHQREQTTGAFARAARFSLRTVAAVAAWSFSRGRDTADRIATERLVGAGAGTIVTVGPRAVGRMTDISEGILEAERARLEESITYEATRGAPPAPTTWSKLRHLCFALADGGEMDDMDAPRQLGRREVLAPQHVAPPPGAAYETRSGDLIEATDPPAMRAYLEDLEASLNALLTEAAELRRRLDDMERLQPSGAAADATDAEAHARWEAEQRDILELLQAAEARVDEAEAALAAFHGWFTDVSTSVLWQVGDDVSRRLGEYAAGRQSYREHRDVTAPATEELTAAKKRLLRRWWLTSILSALALGFLVLVVSEQENRDWQDTAMWAGGIVLVTLALLIGFNHAFYKAFRKYEWQVANALAEQRNRAARYLWEAKEHARLSVLYQGWRDWTTVIAEVLHRPWQPPARQFDDLSDEVVGKFPAAMAVARQEREHVELPPLLLVHGYEAIYQEGWAQQAFDEAYEAFANDALLMASTGYLDVDVDAAATELSPRGQLVTLWRSGKARELLSDRRAERLRELAADGDLQLPMRKVRRAGAHSDGQWQEELDYFAAIATSDTTFALDAFGTVARTQNRHYASHVTAWLPRAAHAHAAEAKSSTVRLQEAEGATAVRVDLSRRLAPQDLTIFMVPVDERGATSETESSDAFL
ncbi:hypothetical protein KZX45_13510 [Georgenia sp. EYE_87]|uniref:hypothetical protein n=1 Tax=Georgenia sp. EYE_87 TaxID=2853448 RepID=UPI00200413FA|nr:hypothetical protein [Georgenia sp. EYE_87]MCK6211562.1 hypothetical protein [Georgenia sp. EYE_87]